MKLKKFYEVIVIGAGPAGLMAGRELKKAGVDFFAIDSKKKIGLPLRCGEGIRQDGFIELFGRKRFGFISNKINNFEVVTPKVKKTVPIRYLILDRPRFEQWLAEPLADNILLDTKFKDLTREKDHVKVLTNKGVFKAKMIILAYGCNYRVQKKLGLVKKSPVIVPCYGGLFSNQGCKIRKDTIYFYFDNKNYTALWLFPKQKNIVNAGIGAVPFYRKKKLTELFDIALDKFGLKLKKKQDFGGVFPTTGSIRKTYTKRALVCGDAAGQVYAGCGEGIYFALKAGRHAGEVSALAVKKNNFSGFFLRKYQIAWKKSIGKQISAGKYFAGMLFLGLKFRKINYLVKMASRKQLFGMFLYGEMPKKAKIVLLFAAMMGHLRPKISGLPWYLKLLGKRAYRKRIQALHIK